MGPMLRAMNFSCGMGRVLALILAAGVLLPRTGQSGAASVEDAVQWAPPAGALGYPSRAPDLDGLPGFQDPPPGYGEVPFWWWLGDPLDRDRLLWQIEELHRMGIAGVQVNYAHEDTNGWPTYPAEPEVFSESWWEFWRYVAGECAKRDMGIGLSGYTLDWPNGRSLVSRTVYSDPEITGREVQVARRVRVGAGETAELDLPPATIAVKAYRLRDGVLTPRLEDLPATGRVRWTAKDGEWEVWVFTTVTKPGSINPVHPLAGQRVVERFFQRFQDHAPGQSARGLNFFFHDELQFGVGDHVWTGDFPAQFAARKGYDVFEALPALFADIGPRTPKARLDYLDVRMQLVQERYFIPIFAWHQSRGLIYGCDQGSRGRDPLEFGDYFSAVRWYTAPGHDTPGGQADLIKGKVSSSIAQLYRRPRVWLEGYHSLGWGATPARLMQATCENYVYGCNLLNLHGLYYSTHGSFWEWAPPCHHFRMPYWDHFGVFLRYFERLSYLLSQGTHLCDLAVLYPVSPGQAGLGGGEATATAFEIGTRLIEGGRDFIFIDDESLARARIQDGRLNVSDADYRVLILPEMRAIRWATLRKAQAFQAAGGIVLAVGALPEASDRAGRDDPELDAAVRDLFGATAAAVRAGERPAPRRGNTGGVAAVLPRDAHLAAGLADILRSLPFDVEGPAPMKATHRRIGPRDVYFLTGAPRGAEYTFRATGRVELWNPWTGGVRPIHTAVPVPGGTRVRLPLGPDEAQLIVFSPEPPILTVTATDLDEVEDVRQDDGRLTLLGVATEPGVKTATVDVAGVRRELRGEALPGRTVLLDGDWECEVRPTLNNRWGDFRLPIEEPVLGPEARTFRYAAEMTPEPGWGAAAVDDAAWPRVTHGFGQKFWKLGPLPADLDVAALEQRLAALGSVDPSLPVGVGGRTYRWVPYDFSWRWGKEGDPGHQGYHGLKRKVTDDFLCLGRPTEGHNEIVYREEPGGTRYYLWTTAFVARRTVVQGVAGGLRPAVVYLDGRVLGNVSSEVALEAGAHPLLLRYDSPGRGHFVLQAREAGSPAVRTPLSMTWQDQPGLLPFDVRPDEPRPAGWYRFTAPPGLRGMTLTALGQVEAWVEGAAVPVRWLETRPGHGGVQKYRVDLARVRERPVRVALRVAQARGAYGGAAIPDPIRLDLGPGRIAAGDWSEGTALESYSGGVWYRRDLVLDAADTRGRVRLDLGDVVATAEVRVNGNPVVIRVAPPWIVDLDRHVSAGTNRLEVLVYNTLANHFLTLPTRYRGSPRSGLLGPVRLQLQPRTLLTE